MSTTRLLIAIIAALPFPLLAQTTILPLWSETWPFGQDEMLVPVGVSPDNHVAVDAITGRILVTIDDQQELFSPHFDILFEFDANGNDLTQTPAPLLGSAAPTVSDPANVESTHDLAARNGAVYHARELNTGFNSGTTGSLHARNADGSGWKLGLGKAGFAHGNGKVLVDGQGAISIRSMDGYTAMIQATDLDGWVQWTKTYDTFGPFRDAVLIGNTIMAAYTGTFVTIDRATGAQLQTNVVYLPSLAPMLATDGTRTYFAYSDFSGNTTWGCVIPGFVPIWTRTAALNINVTELEVDAFGRPWFTGNANDGISPPVLVVTASDGSTHDVFTYGASMNDLAMGTDRAYITGQSLSGATGTYLIAVSTDISTGKIEEPSAPSLAIYPQPASTSLNVTGLRLTNVRVLDATGKTVGTNWLSANVLDVSKLVDGIYFLEGRTPTSTIARRFSVMR